MNRSNSKSEPKTVWYDDGHTMGEAAAAMYLLARCFDCNLISKFSDHELDAVYDRAELDEVVEMAVAEYERDDDDRR